MSTTTTQTCGAVFADHQGEACTCTLPADHPGSHRDETVAPSPVELHAVFATTAAGNTVRVSDPLDWSQTHFQWSALDELRRAGRFPHVKHFEVRSVWLGPDRPLVGPEVRSHDRYDKAPLDLLYTRPVLEGGRGFKTAEGAARRAWKLFAPTFRDRSRVGNRFENPEVEGQGRGGWFYYPNGVTAAQGLDGLARLVQQKRMVVQGNDGRWYVLQDVVPVPA